MKKPTINRVAILFDGLVFSLPEPYRHHHIIRVLSTDRRALRWMKGQFDVQGFVASNGMFVDRQVAFKIVKESGQKFIGEECGSRLYSENLWETPGKWNGVPGSEARQLWEWNENPDVIDSKLKVEKFTGSVKPYSMEFLVADFFHIEGLGVKLPTDVVSYTLYSELFKEPMSSDMTVDDLQVRIKTWQTTWKVLEDLSV